MTKATAKPNDFTIDLEGAGTFTFNRRNYGAQIHIDAEFERIAKGAQDQIVLKHADFLSKYKVLMVACPAGWEDLESVDMDAHPDIEEKLVDLYVALNATLRSFRRSPAAEQAGETAGAGTVPEHGVLGQAVLPPGADGSALPDDDARGR